MYKMRIFVCLCCVLLALSLAPTAQAQGMTASIASGPVVVNGQEIDSSTAQYPLLVYSSVTYVPMTYNLCRFMGLTTDWDSSTKTLFIDRSQERGPFVPDTGSVRRTGSVAVTRAVDPIIVRGVPVDNSAASWPVFIYNNVTYFPLTYDYAVYAFGWTCAWDASTGLVITTPDRPEPPSAAVNTGTPALDAALETLNAFYRQSHTYAGTLTDRRDGSVQTFDAQVDVAVDSSYSVNVKLTANPFVFFENGINVNARYNLDNNLTDDPRFGTAGMIVDSSPGALHIPPYDSATEKAYLSMCLLDCQFSGARAGKIQAFSQAVQGNLTVWNLAISLEADEFSGYDAAIFIDRTADTVTAIQISTDNYTMHMAVTA